MDLSNDRSSTNVDAGNFPIERYSLIRPLGKGGMASVYLTHDRERGVDLAIKISSNLDTARYVAKEFSILKALNHPRIPKVFECGTTEDGRAYFTMEFFPGETLRDLLNEEKLPPMNIRVKLLCQIAETLGAIHRAGYLYNDLKPGNVLVNGENVMFIDFGVAHSQNAPADSEIRGTAEYMSPEQLGHQRTDARSDIYAFGVFAFEFLTGKHPYKTSNAEADDLGRSARVTLSHTAGRIPSAHDFNKDVPQDLSAVVKACMQKKPQDRLPSMEVVSRCLEGVSGRSVWHHVIRDKIARILNRNRRADSGWQWIRAIERRDEVRERKEKTLPAALSVLALALLAGLLPFTRIGEYGSLLSLEGYFEWRGATQPPRDLVVASVNQDTFTALGLSPLKNFPRRYSAEVVEKLVAAGAGLIIMDHGLPPLPDEDDDSDRLAEAIASGPVTIALRQPEQMAEGAAEETCLSGLKRYPTDPRFTGAAKLSLPMMLRRPFDVASVMTLLINPSCPLPARIPIAEALANVGHYHFPLPGPYDLINFYGEPGTLRRVSYEEIIRDDVTTLRAAIAGKTVVAGYQGLKSVNQDQDLFRVSGPGSSQMYGAEIHATIAANLIEGSWIRRLSPGDESLILFVITVLVAGLGVRLPRHWSWLFVLISMTALVEGGYSAFVHLKFFVQVASPIFLTGLAGLTLLANLWFTSARDRRRSNAMAQLGQFKFEKE